MQRYLNNWSTSLLAGISASATTAQVLGADAAKLEPLPGGDHYVVTLTAGEALEIVHITAVSGQQLTLLRSQEGTTAAAWSGGTALEMRVTAAALARHEEASSGGATDLSVTRTATTVTVGSSTGADAQLPAASATEAGVMTAAEQAKLAGIAAGATANATNSQLRDRATHTGEQPISSVTGLQSALDGKQPAEAGKGLSSNDFTTAEKNKLAALESSRFKGMYASLAALQAAHPAAGAGDHADVDAGVGVDVVRYVWDVSDSAWVAVQGSGGSMTPAQVKSAYESNPDTNAFTDSEKTKLSAVAAGATANPNTDSLSEGSTNQYHTAARVRAVVLTGLSTATAAVITATDTVLTALGKLQAQISDKQDTLVSGTTIKTVGGQSLLGSGNVAITAAPPAVESFTGARTLVLADAGKYLRGTDAAAQAVTVPPQSSVAWAADTEIHIERAGAGALTIAAGAGVTINRDARFTAAVGGQFGVVTLKRTAADTWTLFGNLGAA